MYRKLLAILLCTLSALSVVYVTDLAPRVNGSKTPTITTSAPIGGWGTNSNNPFEQVISTNPSNPAEMTIFGLTFQDATCYNCTSDYSLVGFHTTNYWSSNNLANVTLYPGFYTDVDGAGAYSANGTHYGGFFFHWTPPPGGAQYNEGYRIAKSSDGLSWHLTRAPVFSHNLTYTTQRFNGLRLRWDCRSTDYLDR